LQNLDAHNHAPGRGIARQGAFKAGQKALVDAHTLADAQKWPWTEWQLGFDGASQ
jgi:hypothetical protein